MKVSLVSGFMVILTVLSACGASSSVNGLLFGKGTSTQRYEALIDKARIQYDRREYAASGKTLDDLLAAYPASSEAASMRAYSYMGEAGLSFLDIIRVVAFSAKEAEELDDGKLKDCFTENKEVTDKLACVLGVDVKSLTSASGGVSTIRANSPQVAKLTAAVKMLCPYTPADLRITGDIRHDGCGTIKNQKDPLGGKGKFAWALLHLLEASVLNTEVTRLQAQAAAINTGDVNSLINNISSLANAVAANVTNTTGDSIISALDNDLTAVAKAIGSIANLPPSVTSGLDKLKSKLSQAGTGAASTSTTQKSNTVTANTKDKAKTAIVGKAAELNGKSPEEIKKVCDAYKVMGGTTAELSGVNCPS
jgi:hypothetical protein